VTVTLPQNHRSPSAWFQNRSPLQNEIAAAKSVGYQTQLRMWIAEGIRRESRTAM